MSSFDKASTSSGRSAVVNNYCVANLVTHDGKAYIQDANMIVVRTMCWEPIRSSVHSTICRGELNSFIIDVRLQ